jgi:hypothetical protein
MPNTIGGAPALQLLLVVVEGRFDSVAGFVGEMIVRFFAVVEFAAELAEEGELADEAGAAPALGEVEAELEAIPPREFAIDVA